MLYSDKAVSAFVTDEIQINSSQKLLLSETGRETFGAAALKWFGNIWDVTAGKKGSAYDV